MGNVAMAIAAHPDDIDFMMSGTLLLLDKAGYELHYMDIANGSCGTAVHGRDKIIAIRTQEARDAAAALGATFHEPLVDDLQVYYTPELVARLCAVVRRVAPQILLLPSPQDYMEDHSNSCRLAVTAAFCRGMRNFETIPATEPISSEMALYHAMPYGLMDQLRRPIGADTFVDISTVLAAKRKALACHRSQKDWLDASQGLDSYLKTMEEMCAQVGRMSGRFKFAEGWRRHSHLGFGSEEFDPLSEALGELCQEQL